MTKRYKPLGKEFKHCEYYYREIKRNGMRGIYECFETPARDKIFGYVVAKLVNRNEIERANGRKTEAHEEFPGPSKFGKFAWFYMPRDGKGLDLAEKRFQKLNPEEKGVSPSVLEN